MLLSDTDKAGYPPRPDKTAPQFISFWMDEVGLMNLFMLLCHLMPYDFFGKHIMLGLLSRSFNVLSGSLNTKPIWFAFPTVKVTRHRSVLSCWRFPLRHFCSGTIYIFLHSCVTKKVHESVSFSVSLFLLQVNHEFNSWETLGDLLGPEFGARYCWKGNKRGDMPDLKTSTPVLKKKSSKANSY